MPVLSGLAGVCQQLGSRFADQDQFELAALGLDCGIALYGGAVGALYCSEAGSHARFAGGDGLAVASAVRVIRQFLTAALDLADGQQRVGAADLVAGLAEVQADRVWEVRPPV